MPKTFYPILKLWRQNEKNPLSSLTYQQFAELDWAPSYEQGLAQAKKEHKIVMLMFSKKSCKMCNVMKKSVYENDDVAEYVKNFFVPVEIDIEVYPDKYGYQVFGTPTYASATLNRGEFVLITGRTKKQWHTMTRTKEVSELLKDEEEAYLLINESEAHALGMREGECAIISNALGFLELPIRFGTLAPYHLFAPFGYPQTPINTLISVVNDPFSSQSALKSAKVNVATSIIKCFTPLH